MRQIFTFKLVVRTQIISSHCFFNCPPKIAIVRGHFNTLSCAHTCIWRRYLFLFCVTEKTPEGSLRCSFLCPVALCSLSAAIVYCYYYISSISVLVHACVYRCACVCTRARARGIWGIHCDIVSWVLRAAFRERASETEDRMAARHDGQDRLAKNWQRLKKKIKL